MSILELVTRFVAFRRALGERFDGNETILRSFCRAIAPRTHLAQIRLEDTDAFLATSTRSRRHKYLVLRGFFRYAVGLGHLGTLPLSPVVPKRPAPFAPYLYSRDEIRRLLDAIPETQGPNSRMEPATMRALVLLLYGAGLRTGEALHLSVADADLSHALLTIRDTKFFKSRLVPLGPDLTRVLSDYARWRDSVHPPAAGGERTFFVGRHGGAVHRCTLQSAFTRLREHAGIRRTDGGRYQPRLHDLRHAFAVARLTQWYRQGADVQRLVYHLSVYLGHASLADTQIYLTMTPELLLEANRRFERYACQGENHHE